METRMLLSNLVSETGALGTAQKIGPSSGGGPAPSGSISIDQNGTYDVAQYAEAEVEVAGVGGYTLSEIATGAEPSGDIVIEDVDLRKYVFSFSQNIGKVSTTKTDIKGNNAFQQSSITEFVGLNLTRVYSQNAFNGCTNLKKIVIPNATYYDYNMCLNCTALEVADIGGGAINKGGVFQGCHALKTLIIRRNTLCTLGNVTNFAQTPFVSGGSGGTIYIPKVLYDHLGDGSALDYKSATNWSTMDGYGTITWAQIEGSIYETAYADGTPIS